MNLLLLTVDTVRADRLGCYGYEQRTPNIDRLAAEGVLFEQAISNGTYTKSAFPPMLSSTYASMYGGPFQSVSSKRPMLAEILRQHGYRTAGFTSNPLLGANVGYDAGFDAFAEPVPPDEGRGWLDWKGVQRLLSSSPMNQAMMWLGLDTLPPSIYVDGRSITNLGLDWLRQSSEPFFLWLHYMDAHWPYHDHSSLEGAVARAQAWSDRRLMWRSKRNFVGDEMLARLNRLYDDSIQRLDEQIGRLLRELAQSGLEAETGIVVVSDHGEAFYDHGRWQHGAVFDFHEEILRVPLILRAPGLPRGRRVDELIGLIDLPPTLLDLADIDVPSQMEGRSLRPVIDTEAAGAELVISEMVDLDWYCVALRSERYKYVYDERRPGKRLLYDLTEDPDEEKDLYGQRPKIEADFELRLQHHLERIQKVGDRDEAGGWQVEDDVVRRLKALGYID